MIICNECGKKFKNDLEFQGIGKIHKCIDKAMKLSQKELEKKIMEEQ